jgi:hypothetical protein
MQGLKRFNTDIEWSAAVKRKFEKQPRFRYEHYDEGRDALFGKRQGSLKGNSSEFPRAYNLHFDSKKLFNSTHKFIEEQPDLVKMVRKSS